MEMFGIAFLVTIVLVNASTFFRPTSHQKRLYNETASDVGFNKNAHQTQ